MLLLNLMTSYNPKMDWCNTLHLNYGHNVTFNFADGSVFAACSQHHILGVILTISHYSKTGSAIPICLRREMVLTSLNSLSNMPGEIKRC